MASKLCRGAVLAISLGAAAFSSACGGGTSEGAARPTCASSGTELRVATPPEKTHTFDVDCLAAPVNTRFTIKYTNWDDSSHGQHNIEIKDGGESLFKGDAIGGKGRTVTYQVPALPAGVYKFLCTRHTFMDGDFVVG